ncbi:hypothetical protein ACFPJ4_14330 [Lysinimonas soli]|uniref:Uncharacterized protein n=1 Tax=Lysinimonas soli TaxID=1074233 RepID=A0ABW0NVW3_9MICO
MTEFPTDERDVSQEVRQLALVDRIIGLEAEVANLSATYGLGKVARDQIALVKSSTTWRVGTLVLSPIVFVSKLFHRGGTR